MLAPESSSAPGRRWVDQLDAYATHYYSVRAKLVHHHEQEAGGSELEDGIGLQVENEVEMGTPPAELLEELGTAGSDPHLSLAASHRTRAAVTGVPPPEQ